ncbi:MAG: transglycosylase SLT domain-containing protein [Lachnospiraceae bacterium]|nr:transglycosylase SLT domain-containing protein [Lachnospiraceae bacterium]
MALMKVESEYDSTAVSSVGAKGYFQITPVYIAEVNRVHHTNYTMNDVYDLESAHEIFDLMQKAHNKEYDMDKALVLHNGDHKWYKKRVMDAYEDIKKYENIRNKLINL